MKPFLIWNLFCNLKNRALCNMQLKFKRTVTTNTEDQNERVKTKRISGLYPCVICTTHECVSLEGTV